MYRIDDAMSSQGLVLYRYNDETYISEIIETNELGFKLSDIWPRLEKGNVWNYQMYRVTDEYDPIRDFTVTTCQTIEEVKNEYPEYFL